jgi:hypothetical protein
VFDADRGEIEAMPLRDSRPASLRPLTLERPPASVSDMHSGHFDRLAASTHALDLRGCEASPDHVGQQVDRKPMR